MSVLVKGITKGSIAARHEILPESTIMSIDGQPINDVLDLMFYAQKDTMRIHYLDKDQKPDTAIVINDFSAPLGYEVELAPCTQCINKCIFCFVDQMPPNLRQSLYVKDDDFIYSFIYGNFISLTNLSQKDINKIITQHISPLYVSVHTTDPALHKKLFDYDKEFDILHTLNILADGDIEIHAQIVLMPGINDQAALFKTLTDLVEIEQISTIAIVPVGITKYREYLHPLKKFTHAQANELITQVEFMKANRQLSHIYLADEFFIIAQQPIPNENYYDNFDQIENGVGMVRKSWINWKTIRKKYIRMLQSKEGNPTFVTSLSGIQAINPILQDIQKSLPNKSIKASVIHNHFFGEDVTVTGLLTWQDIAQQLTLADDEYPVFSSTIFNSEMKTIDNVLLDEIEAYLKRTAIITDELFASYV